MFGVKFFLLNFLNNFITVGRSSGFLTVDLIKASDGIALMSAFINFKASKDHRGSLPGVLAVLYKCDLWK
jgi:hypothetical protein